MADIKHLVDRFLAWPLPASVRSDPCVTMDYPHQRSGTNLLTAAEAQAMLEHVLGNSPLADATPEPRVSDDELGEFVNDFENDATAGLYFDQRVVLDLRDARATIASQAAELAAWKARFTTLPEGYEISDDATVPLAIELTSQAIELNHAREQIATLCRQNLQWEHARDSWTEEHATAEAALKAAREAAKDREDERRITEEHLNRALVQLRDCEAELRKRDAKALAELHQHFERHGCPPMVDLTSKES